MRPSAVPSPATPRENPMDAFAAAVAAGAPLVAPLVAPLLAPLLTPLVAEVSALRAEVVGLRVEVAGLRHALGDPQPTPFLTRAEVAKQKKISLDTVDRLLRKPGGLRGQKFGRAWRIDPASLHLATESEVAELAAKAQAII